MATTSASLKEILIAVAIVLLSTPGHRYVAAAGNTCSASGYLPGKSGPCNHQNDADCCVEGKSYPQYWCSPPITGAHTHARMTLNGFDSGEDGGGPSQCDDHYHKNSELVVALSTGWYAGGRRCGKNIMIHANGRSVLAKVVDECDSVNGCDEEHSFQRPCANDVVDASEAVWRALQISPEGEHHITWSDAGTGK